MLTHPLFADVHADMRDGASLLHVGALREALAQLAWPALVIALVVVAITVAHQARAGRLADLVYAQTWPLALGAGVAAAAALAILRVLLLVFVGPLTVTLGLGALALVVLLKVADGWVEVLNTAVFAGGLTMIIAAAVELVLLGGAGP